MIVVVCGWCGRDLHPNERCCCDDNADAKPASTRRDDNFTALARAASSVPAREESEQ